MITDNLTKYVKLFPASSVNTKGVIRQFSTFALQFGLSRESYATKIRLLPPKSLGNIVMNKAFTYTWGQFATHRQMDSASVLIQPYCL